MRTALVVGASGLVGKELIKLLLEDPEYQTIISLVRNPTNTNHPKLVEKVISFDELSKVSIESTLLDSYCCLGTTIAKAKTKDNFYKVDFTYCYEFAKLSKSLGISNFCIVTAIGSDPKSKVFYSKVKGDVEKAISGIGFCSTNIVRPSLLLGERQEFRLGEVIFSKISWFLEPIFMGELKKYKPIQGKQVANIMIQITKQQKQGISICYPAEFF